MTSAEQIVAQREAAERAAAIAEVQAQLDAEAKAKREAEEREERVLSLIEDQASLVVEFAEAGHAVLAARDALREALDRMKEVKGQSYHLAAQARDRRVGILCCGDLNGVADDLWHLRQRAHEVAASPHPGGVAGPHGVSLR